MFACFCVFAATGCILVHALLDLGKQFGPERGYYWYVAEYSGWGGTLIFVFVAICFTVLTSLRYYRIVQEEAGKMPALPEMPAVPEMLSFARLQTVYRRVYNTFLGFCVWFALIVLFDFYKAFFLDYTFYEKFDHWTKFFTYYGLQLLVLALLFLLVFRKFHLYFLSIAKDEESFASAPALVNRKTPFWERIFIEWLVFFGFFLTAAMLWLATLLHNLLLFNPFGLLEILVIFSVGSYLVAGVSALLPKGRLLINVAGLCLLYFGAGRIDFYLRKSNGSLKDYLESLQGWPVIYGIMILNIILFFTIFMVLIYGALYLRRKWYNLPVKKAKAMVMSYCIGLVLILGGAVYYQATARLTYCYGKAMSVGFFHIDEKTSARTTAYFLEAMRLSNDDEKNPQNALMVDTFFHFFLEVISNKHPQAAISGYDQAMTLLSVQNRPLGNIQRYVIGRGIAKFHAGDYLRAIEDFTLALSYSDDAEILYARGYAYEKLGELEKAIVDYNTVIEQLSSSYIDPVQVRFETFLPHPGYEDEAHKGVVTRQKFVVYLSELIEIRDRLIPR